MSTTAMKVLDRAEELGMLEPKVIDELRRQVNESKFHVSPEAIVKLLVDKKHLTQFQAKKLVGEVTTEPESEPTTVALGKNHAAKTGSMPGAPSPSADEDELLFGVAPQTSTPPAEADADDEIVDLEAALPPSEPIRTAVTPLSTAKPVPSGKSGKQPAARTITSDEDIVSLEPMEVKKPGEHKPPAPARSAAPPTPSPAPNAAPAPVASTSPGLQPMSGLAPLGSALGPAPQLAPLGGAGLGDPLFGAGGLDALGPPEKKEPESKIKKKRKSGWDSPLLLLGGGGLGVLVIAFIVLYFALTRGSAQELFSEASEAYKAGQYPTAIQLFQKFTSKYPDDGNVSAARVKIGMARIRQSYDGKDISTALSRSQEILPELEKEEAFREARPELEAILPGIADSFASQARTSTDPRRMEELVAKAHEAMNLVNNASYLPTDARERQMALIEGIQEKIRVAERAINQDKALAAAMERLQEKLKAGDITAAYAEREALLQDYPTLAKNPTVISNTLAISQRERDLVTVSTTTQAALTDDPHQATHPQVVLAHRTGDELPAASGASVHLLLKGAVYAIDAATGKIAWRRYVGHDTIIQPLVLENLGGDVVVADQRHHEILRLAAGTGKPVWRQPLGERFAAPVLAGEKIVVTLASGRMVQVDPESGEISRSAQLPQEAYTAPGVDTRKKLLYQASDHSTIFILAADESAGEPLDCQAAYHLGHHSGSIAVPPLALLGYLFVFRNTGVDSSQVHILAPGGKEPLAAVRDPIRLRGQITVPPAVSGRRLVAVSNLGDTLVLDLDPNNAESPITITAKSVGGFSQPTTGYPVLAGSRLMIADRRLADYEVLATRQTLDRGKSSFDSDVFIAPPRLVGNLLIHARRRQGSRSITVTSVDLGSNKSWQMEMAAPLSGVFAFAEQRRFSAVTSDGDLFEVPLDQFKQGLSDQAAGTLRGAVAETYGPPVAVGEGKYAFLERAGTRWALYNSADNGSIRKVDAQTPGPISPSIVPFAGNVLAPLGSGTIWLLDPTTGLVKDETVPFQPELAPDAKVRWLAPLPVDDRQFVAIDAERRAIYLARREEKPQPFLAQTRVIELDYEPISASLAGKALLVVAQREAHDEIMPYSFPSLTAGNAIHLSGRVGKRGLMSAGSHVWCETSDGTLLLISEAGEVAAEVDAGGRSLIAPPIASGGDWLLAFTDGRIALLKAESTELAPIAEASQPLSGSIQLFGPRLIAGSDDGTLHILPARADMR
jgi:TolA-binding protein